MNSLSLSRIKADPCWLASSEYSSIKDHNSLPNKQKDYGTHARPNSAIPLEMLPASSLIPNGLTVKHHRTLWERGGSLHKTWGDSNYQEQDGSAVRCRITAPCHKTHEQAQLIHTLPCVDQRYDVCVCVCDVGREGLRLINVHWE